MRRRRKSFASRIFLFVALALAAALWVAEIPWLIAQGWINADWMPLHQEIADRLRLTDDQVNLLAKVFGLSGSIFAATSTLLASWHFAEMNLPRRLEDWLNDALKGHLETRERYLAFARAGKLGAVPYDLEKSRLMFLRSWLSFFSAKERARVLAASHNVISGRTSAVQTAVEESKERLISAHLIRGYQYASEGDDEKAFAEFCAATEVKPDDLVSRDIAAGFARHVGRLREEEQLLREMEAIALSNGKAVWIARAWRRQAELLDKRKNEQDWLVARRKLAGAWEQIEEMASDDEKQELFRVLTLLCEIQCSRMKIGKLDAALNRMQSILTATNPVSRHEERGGERYDEGRANLVVQRVSELRGDADVDEVGDGAG